MEADSRATWTKFARTLPAPDKGAPQLPQNAGCAARPHRMGCGGGVFCSKSLCAGRLRGQCGAGPRTSNEALVGTTLDGHRRHVHIRTQTRPHFRHRAPSPRLRFREYAAKYECRRTPLAPRAACLRRGRHRRTHSVPRTLTSSPIRAPTRRLRAHHPTSRHRRAHACCGARPQESHCNWPGDWLLPGEYRRYKC